MLTVAAAVVAAAQERTESRGCHRRTDFPVPDDRWLTHLDVTLDASRARRGRWSGGCEAAWSPRA